MPTSKKDAARQQVRDPFLPMTLTAASKRRAIEEAVRSRREAQLHAKANVFTRYLSETLIPDLKESGRTCTAEDFEEAVLLIRDLMAANKGAR